MLVGIGAVVGLTTNLVNIGITLVIFASFGFLIAAIWQKVQIRSAEYVRLRRHQLIHIEKQMGTVSTFINTFSAFYPPCETISFHGICDECKISELAICRSTLSEGALPTILGWFWKIVGVVGFCLIVYDFSSCSKVMLECLGS
jgi:hypothetical protein